MTFLLALGPKIFSQVSRVRNVRVLHKFFIRATIPVVDSKLDSNTNMFDGINGLDALQDDQLKNYQPLRVPPLSSYAIEIH